jgi:predicted nucleotidyltransferase
MTIAQEISGKLSAQMPDLRKRYPIGSLALFGSVVRDDFDPEHSDVDILVEFSGDIGWEFFDLEQELGALLGRKVDLVSRKAIKSHYWEHIRKDLRHV